ncbi:trypsin-like peptidase domain-containing protein [Lysobacter soyae]|uniref:Trypsin-like peptidase domain-containing protein n=1 Tax=Lysobacter soyae TaxID=2764185 RepID=A0ABX8WQH7_9GAMM|nr:trypsin-like peptidase domain-containing protein [Lysobacter sp. CJ11]QYR52837.1 trypsin-like peptidase domain-containing protein [Lysobacter sp. CJ11]
MRKTPTLLVLAAAAAFGGFAATAIREGVEQQAHAEAMPVGAATTLPAMVNGQALPSLAPMLERVLPSVVSVHTKQRVSVSPFGNDPMLRRMFPELTQERINESLGSGVIIDAEKGYILTNHHVIENADDVSVTLSDGRTLKASPVGSDPDTDVAVMRIPAEKLTALPMADSSQLRVGDFVVAVGNPFGVGQTVTSGIVSAVGRSNIPGMGYQNFIQTDASINPGNSGGALVNLQGQLVGINTASFNPRGSMAGNIGLGFAIPTSLARNVMQQLITNKGVVKRGTLGIDTADLSEADARRLGLSSPNGARVTRVYAGSSAESSGLRVGDVITAANGQAITNSDDLRNIQGLQMANATLSLDVIRNGNAMKLSAGLKEQPRDGASLDPRLDGVTFGELPESLRREGASGIIVTAVAPRSRAALAGLRAGDVVLAGSNGPFNDLASFRAGFSNPPSNLVFRVWRNGTQGELLIR